MILVTKTSDQTRRVCVCVFFFYILWFAGRAFDSVFQVSLATISLPSAVLPAFSNHSRYRLD